MTLKHKSTVGHRNTVSGLAALAQAVLLLFWGATASAQEANRLQDIQVQSLPGQRIELKLIHGTRSNLLTVASFRTWRG